MSLQILVADVMSSPVVTTTRDATLEGAAGTVLSEEINSLVVTEDGSPVGIVTGTDMLEGLAALADPETRSVESVMSEPVVTATPSETVGQALETMAAHDIARLVVVEDGELVGLVSTDDIVRYVPQPVHRQELSDRPIPECEYHAHHETAFELSDWHFECNTVSAEGISVGDRVEFSKPISEADVRTFATASGDTNLLHLDEEYATQTRFGTRIVHGTLVGGLISAALARLPGLTIYLSQDLSFLGPVEVGTRVRAVCEVVGTFGTNKFELTTDVYDEDGERVIEGEAAVLVEKPPTTDVVEYDTIAQ